MQFNEVAPAEQARLRQIASAATQKFSAAYDPAIEVHMSNIAAREAWRAHSIISPAVKGTIQGLGPQSCLVALAGA